MEDNLKRAFSEYGLKWYKSDPVDKSRVLNDNLDFKVQNTLIENSRDKNQENKITDVLINKIVEEDERIYYILSNDILIIDLLRDKFDLFFKSIDDPKDKEIGSLFRSGIWSK